MARKRKGVPSFHLNAKRESNVIVHETRERRVLNEPIEYREHEDGSGTIRGYAAVFDKEITIGGAPWGFREKVDRKAFDAALERPDDVRGLFNHDSSLVLGRTTNNTLRLSVDKRGLAYEIDLPDTTVAQDVRVLIKRGDVDGSSFGFIVDEANVDESAVKDGGLPLRTIRSVELFDVSPVTYPAYPQTSVSARNAAIAALEGHAPKTETFSDTDGATVDLEDVTAAVRDEKRTALDALRAWTPPE
jgi:uncharacterized protein